MQNTTRLASSHFQTISMSAKPEVYDIIFAGGGATACVAAGRLAESDSSLKILILEAGPHTRDVQEHTQPGRLVRNLFTQPDKFFVHAAQPTQALADREMAVLSGRAVGGGSVVNFATYTRAAESDYDDWENVYGNKGWGSKDLIPLSKKAETYQGEIFNETHGTSGPIKVSFATEHCNVGEEFLKVAPSFDTKRTLINDMNDFTSVNGYARWARYIDGESGRRSDTAHHYIYDKLANPNLKVLDWQRVIRVLFEDKRAVGVEYIGDASQMDVQPEKKIAYASKLVVLSAGAFGSPSILERSGIGASKVLSKNNIEQIVNLPGVGENYMDHNLVAVPFIGSEDTDSFDRVARGSDADISSYVDEWTKAGTGILANNSLDAGIKLRPIGPEEFEEIGPEFNSRWEEYFLNSKDKPVIGMGTLAAYIGSSPQAEALKNKYYNIYYWAAYPLAIGHVHITEGMNPFGKLDFVSGFLEHPADLGVLRWAYKHGRELARRMKFYRGEFALDQPQFLAGSAAECRPANGPVPISAAKIPYTVEDDKAIDDFHRRAVGTTWHSSGTCAMKPREDGGVVNDRLDVYGVENLKIVDLSIIPSNVGSNTYNTVLTIGEKAALIIAEDLCLTKRK